MKKIGALLLILSIMVMSVIPVSAAKNEKAYFTNMNGAQLTKEQYNYLLNYFSADTLNTMSTDMIANLKKANKLKSTKTTKYIRMDTDIIDGKITAQEDTEVSKDEYDSSPSIKPIKDIGLLYSYSGNTGNPTHETTYKRISIEIVTGASVSVKYVTLTNVWKQIPEYKSFDVLAVSPGSKTMQINTSTTLMSGYQKWDGNIINYDKNSKNFKRGNGTGLWYKGVSLSQDLVDATKYSLENSMTVQFMNGDLTFSARGCYQHAQGNISLSQSQNYTFSSSGMGGLLLFNSSVAKYYDDTQGVQDTLYI